MNRSMKTAVIIPALNEAGAIARVVADVPLNWVNDIIVVDNGSTDRTAEVAREAGARVKREPQRGYGYACAAGVVAAGDADVVIFVDGDYSFRPVEIPLLLEPIREGRMDLVLGSRLMGRLPRGAMPPHARLGNAMVARIVQSLYGIAITDLGPFRAIRRPVLMDLDMREMTYGWPTEMIVKAARRRVRIGEVPVSYHPRLAGRSKVSGNIQASILATVHILGVALRYAR